jgi:hypothetical protein
MASDGSTKELMMTSAAIINDRKSAGVAFNNLNPAVDHFILSMAVIGIIVMLSGSCAPIRFICTVHAYQSSRELS